LGEVVRAPAGTIGATAVNEGDDRAVFDLVVIVDWSGSSTPRSGGDSIWSCALDVDSGEPVLENHRTRGAARDHLHSVLLSSAGQRVLLGFDFSYAYPEGTTAAAGLPGASAWQAMWAHLAAEIVDDERNRNNRFEVAAALNARISSGHGPFWGSPPGRAGESLSARKAPGFAHFSAGGVLAEFRATERRFLDNRLRIASTWQLLGAGSVGSQSLTGIPVLHHLRHHPQLAARSSVWPFETGFTPDPTFGRGDAIVHAEIWPGSIPLDRTLHVVRDAAQVLGLSRHLAALDRAGELGALFAPELSDAERDAALREEGWILGAPAPAPISRSGPL